MKNLKSYQNLYAYYISVGNNRNDVSLQYSRSSKTYNICVMIDYNCVFSSVPITCPVAAKTLFRVKLEEMRKNGDLTA